jgi:glucose-6-phosphate 1-dehydrogenase
VLFGATGDLAGRYLLPALAALQAAGRLPRGFAIIGASRETMDDETFRRSARERLEQHASDVPATARETLVRALRYRRTDVADAQSVASVIEPGPGAVSAYLALPPTLFPAAVTALGRIALPAGSRIVLEKPFGEDLRSATALNRLLEEKLGQAGENAVFRVDHVLGMATVQNLVTLRVANHFLEAIWNCNHVDQVEILWEETLGLEGRAGYYDRAGALKDVLQNHMLQLLALVAMDPPSDLEAHDLHDRKLRALRSVRPLTLADVSDRSRRARYVAGRLATGVDVRAYAEEDGVEPGRETETFAEVSLELDTPRWAGTRFVLRAGKALARRRKMVIVRFRSTRQEASHLAIGVDGPQDLGLQLIGGAPESPTRLKLCSTPPGLDVPAYGRVLLDILNGRSTLAVGGDEAEQAWRIVTPVLDAWADDVVPLEEYPAGSTGPRTAANAARNDLDRRLRAGERRRGR